MREAELFDLAPDMDTYIYLLFLRMSLGFFLSLSIFNVAVAMPLYISGSSQASQYETILPWIQCVSIANVIGDDNRLLAASCIGCLNWLALCGFALFFRRKVAAATASFTLNKYEDEDDMVAGQSLLLENLPADMKLHNAEHHTKALF